MANACVAFYISGHGFGHCARSIEVIRALTTARPDTRIVVRTAAPRWLFETTAPPVELQEVETDTGVVQHDSLDIDEAATVERAAAFYAGFASRVDDEVRHLRALRATLVVGDVPPLAFAAAARAGLPSVAIANFTWDWIYSGYPEFERQAPHVIPIIRDACATATLTLRLPLHGGFETMMPTVRDIPFVARCSQRDPVDTRRRLGIDATRPVVLASFGAYGAALPVDELRRSTRFHLLLAPREPPAGLRYEDLVAAADVVVSKPGYGIVSECVANDAALLYTSRGRFVEYDLFVREMPRVLRCRYISRTDLLAGRWADAIDALLAQPTPPMHPDVDGAAVAARYVDELLR